MYALPSASYVYVAQKTACNNVPEAELDRCEQRFPPLPDLTKGFAPEECRLFRRRSHWRKSRLTSLLAGYLLHGKA